MHAARRKRQRHGRFRQRTRRGLGGHGPEHRLDVVEHPARVAREPWREHGGARDRRRAGLRRDDVQVTNVLQQSQGSIAQLARAGDAHTRHLDDHLRCAGSASVNVASSAACASASSNESGAPSSAATAGRPRRRCVRVRCAAARWRPARSTPTAPPMLQDRVRPLPPPHGLPRCGPAQHSPRRRSGPRAPLRCPAGASSPARSRAVRLQLSRALPRRQAVTTANGHRAPDRHRHSLRTGRPTRVPAERQAGAEPRARSTRKVLTRCSGMGLTSRKPGSAPNHGAAPQGLLVARALRGGRRGRCRVASGRATARPRSDRERCGVSAGSVRRCAATAPPPRARARPASGAHGPARASGRPRRAVRARSPAAPCAPASRPSWRIANSSGAVASTVSSSRSNACAAFSAAASNCPGTRARAAVPRTSVGGGAKRSGTALPAGAGSSAFDLQCRGPASRTRRGRCGPMPPAHRPARGRPAPPAARCTRRASSVGRTRANN